MTNEVIGIDNEELPNLPQEEARLGQYASKNKAVKETYRRKRETGQPHTVAKTKTWRGLKPYRCWMVKLRD